ncbi:MAG: TonB-dependent receptor, partial [Muribaculaceae bacterium]|nr:TonB-dependent receptor [Muribaculaceae bacterium]
MKIIAVTLALLTAAFPVSAHDTDSVNVTAVRELRPVEVLGIKQMPSPSASPVSIINRATVNRLGIYAIKDIGEIVPNFYTPAYGSRMTSSIYVRGRGARRDQAVVGLN